MDRIKLIATSLVVMLILALIAGIIWFTWPYLVWARHNLGNILVTFITTAVTWFLLAVLVRFLKRG
jgi:hypothetical protein